MSTLTDELGLEAPEDTDPADVPFYLKKVVDKLEQILVDGDVRTWTPGDFKQSSRSASHGRWLKLRNAELTQAEIETELGLSAGDAAGLVAAWGTGATSKYGVAAIGKVKLPDPSDRALMGVGPSHLVGSTGGSETVALTAAQSGLPAHSHGVTDPGHNHPGAGPTHIHDNGTLVAANHSHTPGSLVVNGHTHGVGTLSVGSHIHAPGSLTAPSHGHAAAGGSSPLYVAGHSHGGAGLIGESHSHTAGGGVDPLRVAGHTHGDGSLSTAVSALDRLVAFATSGQALSYSTHTHDVTGETASAGPIVLGKVANSGVLDISGSTADSGTLMVSGSVANSGVLGLSGSTASAAPDMIGSTASVAPAVSGTTGLSQPDVSGSTGGPSNAVTGSKAAGVSVSQKPDQNAAVSHSVMQPWIALGTMFVRV